MPTATAPRRAARTRAHAYPPNPPDPLTITHEKDFRGTPWILSVDVDAVRWHPGQPFPTRVAAREFAATDGVWAGIHADLVAILTRRPLPTPDGGTDHDRAQAAMRWLAEHHPHPLSPPTHRCDCGAPLAYTGGRWGHTTVRACPTPQPMRCLCAHRIGCDEPVPWPGRPCAFDTAGRRCCSGCWERVS